MVQTVILQGGDPIAVPRGASRSSHRAQRCTAEDDDDLQRKPRGSQPRAKSVQPRKMAFPTHSKALIRYFPAAKPKQNQSRIKARVNTPYKLATDFFIETEVHSRERTYITPGHQLIIQSPVSGTRKFRVPTVQSSGACLVPNTQTTGLLRNWASKDSD